MKNSKAQEIVDLQLKYYNNHDLDGFCSTFSEDVEVYNKDKLVAKGLDELRKRYKSPIESLKYVAVAKNKIIHKNKAIYLEDYGKKDNLTKTCLAIYDVKYGLIYKMQIF